MGWDGAGSYTRTHNFSADASAGIKILASRMDQEFNDMASAISITLTKDGQNTPSANLPMGGRRHVNVGAAGSATDYLRAREFISNIPIYVEPGTGTGISSVSASVSYFTTVSAAHPPSEGTRLLMRMPNYNTALATATANFTLNTPTGAYGAKLLADNGLPLFQTQLRPNAMYDLVYNSALAGYQVMNPSQNADGAYLSNGAAGAKTMISRNAAGTLAADGVNIGVMMKHAGVLHVLQITSTVSVSVSISAANLVLAISGGVFGGTDAVPLGTNPVVIKIGSVYDTARVSLGSASATFVPVSVALAANTVILVPPQTLTWLASTEYF